jgi:hypothetical protein
VWFNDTRPIIIRLQLCYELEISIRYADGLAYSGRILFEYGSYRTEYDIEDGVLVKELAVGPEVSIFARSRRPGFGDARSSPATESTKEYKRRLEVILPAVETEGGVLEIDLVHYPANATVSIGVSAVSKDVQGYMGSDKGGRIHSTRVLLPGRFLVSVWEIPETFEKDPQGCGPVLWWREEVEVANGLTTRLSPIPIQSGRLTVRVLDTKGEPLIKARLAPRGSSYTRWKSNERLKPGAHSPVPGMFALTDESGRATLCGICPYLTSFVVESPGMAAVNLDLAITAGQATDLGDIVLSPATGTIEICITEPIEESEYEVYLLQPGGVDVYGPIRFHGASYVIEGLAPRKYTVAVRKIGGGYSAPSRNILLTEDAPAATVSFAFKPVLNEK